VWEDPAETGARDAEGQDDQRQHQEAAKLAVTFGLLACDVTRLAVGELAQLLRRGYRNSGRRGALPGGWHELFRQLLVDEEMDAQLELRAVEFLGQRRELAFAGD
jgi:hypothetical protein